MADGKPSDRPAAPPHSMQGPGIFLAQFIRDEPPFNTFIGICRWAVELGYRGVQVPVWAQQFIDLDEAAESEAYCDDWREKLSLHGLTLTELNASLAGQTLAMHPAYEVAFQPFYPAGLDDRLESLLKTEGTSIRNDAISILYYRMRYGRISPVDTMVPGDWQRAIPRLYSQMQETLARWRAEEDGAASP